MSDTTRIYIASDFHAAEKAWRKFLNAIKLNVYKADVALVAGDFTGKAIVPIVETDGAYEADLFGVHRRAGSPEELATLERDIADVGYYSAVMSAADTERLSTDPAARDELLHGLMNDRMEKWMTLATERLAGGGVPLFVIPGNDDDFGIDPILDRETSFRRTPTAGCWTCPATCRSWPTAGRTTRPGTLPGRCPRTSCSSVWTNWQPRCATPAGPCS